MRSVTSYLVCAARLVVCALLIALAAGESRAAEGFRLSAPDELVDTGVLKHILPRFSLKTGIPIELVLDGAEAEVALRSGGNGRVVFIGPNTTWRMRVRAQDHAGAARFADWLTSEIGQCAITGFAPTGVALFSLTDEEQVEEAEISFDGNAKRGRELSTVHCGRCHVVSDDNRMNAIGSTPSFFVLRTFVDWDTRFQSFYALKPHPAFTQVADVTAPFPSNLPPPIIPVEITLDDIEAILAYVSAITPANLGAPLQHQ